MADLDRTNPNLPLRRHQIEALGSYTSMNSSPGAPGEPEESAGSRNIPGQLPRITPRFQRLPCRSKREFLTTSLSPILEAANEDSDVIPRDLDTESACSDTFPILATSTSIREKKLRRESGIPAENLPLPVSASLARGTHTAGINPQSPADNFLPSGRISFRTFSFLRGATKSLIGRPFFKKQATHQHGGSHQRSASLPINLSRAQEPAASRGCCYNGTCSQPHNNISPREKRLVAARAQLYKPTSYHFVTGPHPACSGPSSDLDVEERGEKGPHLGAIWNPFAEPAVPVPEKKWLKQNPGGEYLQHARSRWEHQISRRDALLGEAIRDAGAYIEATHAAIADPATIFDVDIFASADAAAAKATKNDREVNLAVWTCKLREALLVETLRGADVIVIAAVVNKDPVALANWALKTREASMKQTAHDAEVDVLAAVEYFDDDPAALDRWTLKNKEMEALTRTGNYRSRRVCECKEFDHKYAEFPFFVSKGRTCNHKEWLERAKKHANTRKMCDEGHAMWEESKKMEEEKAEQRLRNKRVNEQYIGLGTWWWTADEKEKEKMRDLLKGNVTARPCLAWRIFGPFGGK